MAGARGWHKVRPGGTLPGPGGSNYLALTPPPVKFAPVMSAATEPSWSQYLSGQSLAGFLDFLAFHSPVVEAAVENKPRKAIEIGCGGANLAIFLSHLGIESYGLDLSDGVLQEALRHSRSLAGQVRFLRGDGFSTPFAAGAFDVSLSQGVLEHFDDERIEAFLAESIRISCRTIATVPNAWYPSRDFGDERLMKSDFWRLRAERAVEQAGAQARGARVSVTDYRRRTDLRHPLRTLLNIAGHRGIFTLMVIDRT